MSKLQKTALEKDFFNPDTLSLYVDTLKLHLAQGKIQDKNVIEIIELFPCQSKILYELSNEEIKIIFESVGWAWRQVTGDDIEKDINHMSKQQEMDGNYWILNKGITLKGVNSYQIVKKHLDLFSSILKIDPFVLHQRLSTHPNDLIKTVICNGGMRVFVNKDNKAYFQLNQKAYSEWGKSFILNLDAKEKFVKLIDTRASFTGWASGILIKLK
jgi:hypothetical protein